jgi:hypothetical protein
VTERCLHHGSMIIDNRAIHLEVAKNFFLLLIQSMLAGESRVNITLARPDRFEQRNKRASVSWRQTMSSLLGYHHRIFLYTAMLASLQ